VTVQPFDPQRLLTVLADHGVEFVLIGAMTARLHGFPRLTAGADITPARDPENLERLAAALQKLDARIFTEAFPEGIAFDVSAKALARAEIWNLVTVAGRLDLVFTPAGTTGYADLAPSAVLFHLFGSTLRAARLEDILRSKEAADRPQDRQDAIVIREMLRRSSELGSRVRANPGGHADGDKQ
jgi:hypothetical protein